MATVAGPQLFMLCDSCRTVGILNEAGRLTVAGLTRLVIGLGSGGGNGVAVGAILAGVAAATTAVVGVAVAAGLTVGVLVTLPCCFGVAVIVPLVRAATVGLKLGSAVLCRMGVAVAAAAIAAIVGVFSSSAVASGGGGGKKYAIAGVKATVGVGGNSRENSRCAVSQ